MSLTNLVVWCMIIAYCECINTHALFRSEPSLANMMCLQDKVEFQKVQRSVIECVKLCAVNSRCHSLIFYHGNKTCFGLKVNNPFPDAVSIPMPGAVFYRTNTTSTTVTTTGTHSSGCNVSIPMVEPLSDSQFSASSEFNADYAASRAKLGDTRCWTPETNLLHQYLQVDFSEPRIVTSIITQGSPQYQQWMTTYKISFSNDCTTFMYITDGSGNEKIFDGNIDPLSIVENALEPPIVTRCFRIEMDTWVGGLYISLRLEAMGCLA